MNKVHHLIVEVGIARNKYISIIQNLTQEKAMYKEVQNVWNVVEITEHLFWAEQGGIFGMCKTLHAIREGKMEKTIESIHKDMPIQTLIDLTWKEKEEVPAVAAPRMGGMLAFWQYSLSSLQPVLEAFGNDLQEDELRIQAHPHPISGAMDFQQRLEFLAFHIDRHENQVNQIINSIEYN
ncbi:MAG: DinB family protein [Sphingobacteriales bacterium]